MGLKTIVGIILLTLGVLGLIYGGFTYTEDRHEVDIGPVEFGIEEKQRVNVPIWMSVVAVALGAVSILWGRGSRSVTG